MGVPDGAKAESGAAAGEPRRTRARGDEFNTAARLGRWWRRSPRDAAFWILLGAVASAPIPFGAVYQWAWGGTAAAAGAAALLICISALLGARAIVVPGPMVATAVLLYWLVVLWAYIQTLSATPANLHHPAWSLLERAGLPERGAISIAPDDGLDAIVRLLAYGVVFWVGLQLAGRSVRVRTALKVLVVAATVYAAYGLLAQFLLPGSLPWIERPSYGRDVTGTFVNRNVFASYAGLALLCGLALVARAFMVLDEGGGWRSVLRKTMIQHSGVFALFAVCATVLTGSLLLSGSRAGVASALAAVAVFMGCLGWSWLSGRRLMPMLALTLLACSVLTFVVAGGRIAERLQGYGHSIEGRVTVYQSALSAISERPVLGTGAGTFADSFLMREGDTLGRFAYAHNLYIETAVELGLPALCVLLVAAVLIALALGRALRHRYINPVYPALGLSALAMVASHGLLDFTTSIPAVALTFALILGLAVGSTFDRRPAQTG